VKDGMAFGEFAATGYVPRCLPRIRACGLQLPEALFQERTLVPLTEIGPTSYTVDSQRLAVADGMRPDSNSIFMLDLPADKPGKTAPQSPPRRKRGSDRDAGSTEESL